ncbi:serine/threonine protein kinase [Sphaeroforma arctica JP610]|uniref:Serine/threonine protein kinase n=1 Tax=Sphaeroforma arctica JP610 TaxID=667725 RepID=A0A0L0FJI3_9EUKA|nr:serine/threonine protein kinase [Sphaeroforma arctica JP610]KNC76183.1 serine/threonine protein kinase [Sphaeroforma arctica JP610]|eukprot:XP_014150085.1 serine/threonine protein kinase [Sphaeroforma arctica JP610]
MTATLQSTVNAQASGLMTAQKINCLRADFHQKRNSYKAEKRFVNERRLQIGSTAVVSKAFDRRLGCYVALKRMEIERYINANKKEFHIGKAMGQHPNVVTTYEKLFINKQVCIVMDCLDGGDLVDILADREAGFDHQEFLTFARQLAAGLSHIHSKGVAHRDIKSDNISVSTKDGQAKILDFGESQFVSEPMVSLKSGTLPYMAPELVSAIEECRGQYNVGDVDLDLMKTDVWSMGITFYSMYTSQIPFGCASLQDSGFRNYLQRHVFGAPGVWAAVDEDIKILLENMCEPDPELRWSMDMVVKYLNELCKRESHK